MAQPTEQQIEAAAKHAQRVWLRESRDWNAIMREVAPMLQVVWEPLKPVEFAEIVHRKEIDSLAEAVNNFIAKRNAALVSNPDERVQIVANVLRGMTVREDELGDRHIAMGKQIVAALDKAKLAVE